MIRLGAAYANGQGIDKDDAAAVGWYRKAADQNNSDGVLNLAAMSDYGRGLFSLIGNTTYLPPLRRDSRSPRYCAKV